MHGYITFESLEQVAEFLGHFTGASTATFKVEQDGAHWLLTFTGGF